MQTYYPEEDPYLSRSYGLNGKHVGKETFYNAEDAGWERCGPEDAEPAQASYDAFDAKADGWEMLGQNAQKSVHLGGLGIYDNIDAHAKVASRDPKSKQNDVVKGQTLSATRRADLNKAWEVVPHEPDWDMVNRKETREARRATKTDAPAAEDWVMYNKIPGAEEDTFEGRHCWAGEPVPPTSQSQTGMHEQTAIQTEQDVEPLPPLETTESLSQCSRERLLRSQKDGSQPQAQASQTTPAKPQHSSHKEHQSCFPSCHPTGHALKHNPLKQRPFSAEEKDLPFLAPPTPSQASTMQTSARPEYPHIIQNLRAASVMERESPQQNTAAAASEAAARRTDERFARTERVPFDWYGITYRANPRRYR
ncbi:hypothetical protein A1O7_05502 [Cladophialophora yegresii CBS 114405]|uniref:Uncharacterized protein n=1 Tax=Cladophialophora yegresii CBS 114405 TaxID=1182544 RepID=W9VR98_9EURO|nr:uncharacterized protein A1O7_05502 [Cladophialophora yegresii CBS 114405]EXJ58078.1 hypothetical protein A1O7_05502 [Cladophialophora yegresii CBS 114405]